MADWPSYKNFIYMEDRGFIFAYVPKAACTNWKSLLRYMAGHEDWLDNRLAHDKVNGGLRYLDLEGPDAELLSRPDIKKYTMVRDPYSRVLSAYLNKVEQRLPVKPEGEGDHFDQIVRDIEAYRRDALGNSAYPDITFEVFLLWLRDSGSWFAKDEHWAPQTVLLRQPEVKFDIIGRFEQLEKDSRKILDAMGCDQQFPSQEEVKFAPTAASDKISTYFTAEATGLVDALYTKDFNAFGYDRKRGIGNDASPNAPATALVRQPAPANSRDIPSMSDRDYPTRMPLKADALAILRDLEIPVATVIDVGVQTATEELIDAYPDRHHLLIEPITEYHSAIERRYGREGIAYTLVPVAAADEDGYSDMVMIIVGDGKTVTHSRLTDERATITDLNSRRVPMRTLDTLVAENSLAGPFALKIDVDGAELRVLAGAKKTLQNCTVVIIEVQIHNLLERAAPIVAAGLELFDVVDLCYHDHRLSQMDMIFVNKAVLETEGKTIFAKGFDPGAWFKLKNTSLTA